MRILVCGSRNWKDGEVIKFAVQRECDRSKLPAPMHCVLMHGDARGADRIAGEVGEFLGIQVEAFPAAWGIWGKKAGMIRNAEMLNHKPDVVLAFWDGDPKGTKHMIKMAQGKGITTRVFMYQNGIAKEVDV